MTRRFTSTRYPPSLSGESEPDDPYFDSRARSASRKTTQLCAQVQRTLSFLLETECSDECLQGFYVESVEPHPNAARLLVVLRQWDRRQSIDLAAALQRLAALKGPWRSEVGRAISRKRTPDLVFQVLLDGATQ